MGSFRPSLDTGASGKSARRPPCSHDQLRPWLYEIHTSPPACSLERVMAAFKTRSQLLLAQIERDEVHCPQKTLKERSEDEEEEWGERDSGCKERRERRSQTVNLLRLKKAETQSRASLQN
uniref:kinesin-like protein KIF27 n=1 Tax=Oncorhynchus gorbuscha TaxID=8017 RepID=UPI001EAF33F2|nr:kinesin-like protein KIF27 [Oncorhynchus gorbuscha]